MLHGSRPEKIAESQAAVRTPKGEPGFRAEELSQAIHSTHFRSKGSEYCEIEKNKRTAKSQLRLKIWRGVAQLFLPLTAFGFAGEQPLVIASQAGAPVLLSGTVTAAETLATRQRYSYALKASITNISTKPILLLITNLGVTREGEEFTSRSFTEIQDYFFRSELLEPNATKSWKALMTPFRSAEDKPASTAIASVIFAQFADGSTWGDAKAAEETLSQRRLTLDRLTFLADTYRTQGEQQFVAELVQQSELVVINSLQHVFAENNRDAVVVMKKLTSILNAAHLHRAAM